MLTFPRPCTVFTVSVSTIAVLFLLLSTAGARAVDTFAEDCANQSWAVGGDGFDDVLRVADTSALCDYDDEDSSQGVDCPRGWTKQAWITVTITTHDPLLGKPKTTSEAGEPDYQCVKCDDDGCKKAKKGYGVCTPDYDVERTKKTEGKTTTVVIKSKGTCKCRIGL